MSKRKSKGPVLMSVQLSLAGNLVRLNIAQDVEVLGETTQVGRDIDLPLDTMSKSLRKELLAVATDLAADQGATLYVRD